MSCSKARPDQQAPVQNAKPRACLVDGALLEPNGYCHAGSGWPITEPVQPCACSHCRRFLPWSGVCVTCIAPGAMSEGDRYEPQDAHWRRVSGPAMLFTDAQNREALAVVQRVFRHQVTEAEGHAEIDRIAATSLPF